MNFNELLQSLAAPAQRALDNANIGSFEDLTNFKYHQIKQLHGIGPNALNAIVKAMLEENLEFKSLTKHFEFEAILEKVEGIDGAYITVPFDLYEEFGVKRAKVKAQFDGVEYSGSIVNMGTGNYILGVLQSIRKQINKQPGDSVHVIIDVIL